MLNKKLGLEYFKTIFSEGANEFVKTLDIKSQKKLFYNVRIAEKANDPKLFKKLNNEIWEFRVRFSNKQIRLLAFWDQRNNKNTLVIATNGFIKKTQKIPKKEINRAEKIRKEYFE